MSQTEISDVDTFPDEESGTANTSIPPEPPHTTFWSSMPRVLTALAGLVTALGTAGAVYLSGGSSAEPPPAPPEPPVVILQQPAAPTPSSGQAIVNGAESGHTSDAISGQAVPSGFGDADEILAEWVGQLDADTTLIFEGCADGYADDCELMLDTLLGECEAGYPLSCDVLWMASPDGSALQEYGNTCGGRVHSTNTRWCRDLATS